MPLGFLRAPGQRAQLGKQRGDDAEVQGEGPPDRGPRGQQQELLEFSPDALGRQIVERNAAAQCRGAIVDGEFEARGQLHRAQDAQTVVGKRGRIDNAQAAPIEVDAAVERVEIFAAERIP